MNLSNEVYYSDMEIGSESSPSPTHSHCHSSITDYVVLHQQSFSLFSEERDCFAKFGIL